MKQYYLILLLTLPFCVFSQDYRFNLVTNYLIDHQNNKNNSFKYSNINDSNYFLSIHNNSENNASITDYRIKKVHFLKYKKFQTEEGVSFEFNYINTTDLIDPKINSNYVAEFENIKQDSLHKTVKMTMYKNKRKKNIAYVIELIIKNHQKKLFPLYRISCLHPFEQMLSLDYGEKGIVESSKLIGKRKMETQLDYYQEIELVIKIPKKLIINKN